MASRTYVLRFFLFVMMMVTGVNVWGQTDYPGIFYIAHNNNNNYSTETQADHWYVVPAADPHQTNNCDAYYSPDYSVSNGDPAKPYLTVYKTNRDNNSVWVIQPVDGESGFYYLIHVLTGKYVVYEPPFAANKPNRKSMHLLTTTSPGDNAKFQISIIDSRLRFNPKGITSGSCYFNPAGSHKNQYYANGGTDGVATQYIDLIGLAADGNNSRWCTEAALLAAPTISDVSPSNTITITDANSLPKGYTIRYTTDGTDPTATTGTVYSGPIDVISNWTVKAVVVRYGIVLTSVASKAVIPVLAAPTVTNNYDGTISLSSTTPNTKIYYTTDGTTPSSSNGTLYSSAFSLGNATVIKAITYNSAGTLSSAVVTYNVPPYTAPTISFNSSTSLVTITSEGTAYYNTGDGSQADPTTSSTTYSAPFTISSATTVKAIATHLGYIPSEVATLAIPQVATPTIQNNGSNAISITSATDGATIYYTTDGSTPTTSSTEYTDPLTENVSNVTIKAIAVKENMIPSAVGSGSVKLQCATPVITRDGMTFSISCSMPTDATFYYSLDGTTPATLYNGPVSFTSDQLPMTVTAVAKHANYNDSENATFELLNGTGTSTDPYLIYGATDFANFITNVNAGTTSSKCYKLETDVSASEVSAITTAFSGTFDGNFHIISNIGHALFNTIDGGTVKNVILQDVNISTGTNVGAICNEATGDSRIYNCGVLGTLTETKDDYGNVTNITSTSTISGSGYVGSIVGLLDGTSRVINCYSYATVSGGTMAAGIVGNNSQASTQSDLKTIVVNCMFYGDIKGGSAQYPVYGNNSINNDSDTGINPYCYFRKNATFTPTAYNRSWPAEEKNLTRFEYYRSVLNSNRKLCTWWVNGTNGTVPTDNDVYDVGIAKWVLDPSIAPYPILKAWDKYPSIINLDPTRVWDPRTEDADGNPLTPHWVQRSNANEWEGKSYGTLSVTINAGAHGSGSTSTSRDITITDMDTLNYDYSYYKIQLPYYNEVFGNPNGTTHAAKYAGNYTEYVVTGWEVSGGSDAENYNFADRNSYKGRIFAQGGYFYVPKNVSSITITAHWGKAVYLTNRGYSIDRVNVTAGGYRNADKTEANNFVPAGTVSNTFQGNTVYDDLQTAIQALGSSTDYPTVYDQAIVLIGNHQVKNGNNAVNNSLGGWHPFTIMSADFDFDNEPDYCLQLQFRTDTSRPAIQPIRFDFLPVIELGLAVRHDNLAYAIGVFVPQGHFEITETSFMRTTQFEWDSKNITKMDNKDWPVILNGGEFEQLAIRYANGNRTNYFLLGGHLWFHRFAPGFHPNKSNDNNPTIRLCPVNVIGGDYPEFYLSGLYRPDKPAFADQGDPICYISGGHFGTIHGSGYDKITGNVTFKIDHAVIGEFYGGGINGSNPIGGNIDVTIDNSRVDKYCGGPEVGDMTGKTVTTHATGTTFGVFYGGGNGGNSYYRQLQFDGDQNSSNIGTWTGSYNWGGFNPLNTNYDDGSEIGQTGKDKKNENKGYHAEYEFEVFNQSNGVTDEITQRGFIRWIQFGITITGNVENTLTDCTITNNFYGGGNLATVDGTVTSTLTNTVVDGSVFGAGYSAAIPKFQVHDKSTASFPSITAGVITDGHIDHNSNVYEWTNDLNGKTEAQRKADPTYQKGGKWYCYTWNSLENLGAVLNSVSLTINGNSVIGTASDSDSGNVYGGGDASAVSGDVTVNLQGNTEVLGNVFGGGNEGVVEGSTEVNIEE